MKVHVHGWLGVCVSRVCVRSRACVPHERLQPSFKKKNNFLLLPLFWETSHYTTLREPSTLQRATNRRVESAAERAAWSEREHELKASVEGRKLLSTPSVGARLGSCEAEPNLTLTSQSFCSNTRHSPGRPPLLFCEAS